MILCSAQRTLAMTALQRAAGKDRRAAAFASVDASRSWGRHRYGLRPA